MAGRSASCARRRTIVPVGTPAESPEDVPSDLLDVPLEYATDSGIRAAASAAESSYGQCSANQARPGLQAVITARHRSMAVNAGTSA